jgi:histidine ammonia-lyase
MKDSVVFDGSDLSLTDIVELSQQNKKALLSRDADFVERIERGARLVDSVLSNEGEVYGITTGYGDSVTTSVAEHQVNQLPINLTRFHGCGLGAYFSAEETRAILAVRLCSLCRGYSGVSYALLERLTLMLNENVLPMIPEEGSVGASGDLTPLSYIAGALIGERDVVINGEVMNSAKAFDALGLETYQLRPKEALALMNGTAVMTALACLTFARADNLTSVSSRITSLMTVAVAGNPYHFDAALHAVKPHQGQQQVARWIADDLGVEQARKPTQTRLQDRYSLRCAPHIIGVVRDCLPFLRQTIDNELNSANDNPIVDVENQRIHHGGHFYGGHIAMAMDTLKTQVANLADLHDRQMALLLDTKSNNGLPPNLSAAEGDDLAISHGFKAVQIGCSAWTAEALKLTMPASVFSRSTECHNQDKVSMGTIAARDCRRVLELTQQVVAASLLAATHGVKLRCLVSPGTEIKPSLQDYVDSFVSEHPLLTEDRPLENELRALTRWVGRARGAT